MLRAGLRAYLGTLAAEPDVARMLVIEAVGAGPRVLRRRAEAFDDFVRALAAPLRVAHHQDPSVPEPDGRLLLGVLGGINELVLHHLIASDPRTLLQLAPVAEQLLERVCFPAG
jgi:hypothetical protein